MKKVFILLLVAAFSSCTFSQTFSDRTSDPYILKGSNVASYVTTPADEIVGFKYAGGSWIQIPIQIDEMELKDIVAGYGSVAVGSQFPPSSNNPKILFYCDSSTNIGADSNINFDADDELVFMIKDAGEQFNGTNHPNACISGSGLQIQLTDPATGNTRYVYLFRQDGTLEQDADSSYVNYTSNVSGVTGWPAHLNGLNNENTTIGSAKYSWHISAEWKSDELKIALGSNVDILDRHKNFFADGFCGRSENTFSDAENAYLIAKAGPLRVIRSVMGANSGPLTQRTHLFYEGRFDIITNLRVHSIPSVFDVFDYSPAATGMMYSNNINGATTPTINGLGTADGMNVNSVLSWEQVKGTQGTLSLLHRKSTDINSVPSDNTTFLAYYNDNSSSPGSNCTGDGQAWGTSGWGATFTGAPTTDPLGDAGAANLRFLQATRIAYVNTPTVADTTALHYNTLFNLPVTALVSPFNTNPPLAATISATSITCAGGLSTITIDTTGGSGAIEFDWAHSPAETNNSVSVTSGTYTVTVSDNDTAVALSITISSPPAIDTSVTVSQDKQTATANQANATYIWINCIGQQVITGNQSFTPPVSGNYAVIITNDSACVDTSGCVFLESPSSIQSNEKQISVALYPNPTSHSTVLQVEIDDYLNLMYEVVDIAGRTIAFGYITNQQTFITTNEYSAGMYVVKVKREEQVVKAIRLLKN